MKSNLNIRNLIIAFSILSMLLSVLASHAQKPDGVNSVQTETNEILYPKNNFKINLSSLAFNSYSLYYERSITRKISFSAGYRTMPTTNLGSLPLAKELNKRLSGNEDDDPLEDIKRMDASGSAYTGEFRFYGGKKAGARGIYLSLYGRYAQFDHAYDYFFTDENGNIVSLPIKSQVKGFGGGIMLGRQFLIAKRVALDLYIIGGHYGKLTGTSNGLADLSSLSEEDKLNLREELDNIIVINEKPMLNSTITNQGMAGKISGPFAGVRGLGFSLGIAF